MEVSEVLIKSVYAIIVVSVLMGFCSYAVLAERKISSWIQGRVGPNRTTLPLIGSIPVLGRALTRLGIFQPIADGAKFLFKEDVIPAHVNKVYFILAPIISLIPALTTVAVVPFGYYQDEAGEVINLVLADINVAILFLFAVSSLGVYGIVLAQRSDSLPLRGFFAGRLRNRSRRMGFEFEVSISWRHSRLRSDDFL